jgi:nucleotide-binding universal stress UspA family protein
MTATEDAVKKILVTTDGTDGSLKALTWAADKARKEAAEVIVVFAEEQFCPVGLDEMDCNTIVCLLDKEAANIIGSSVEKLRALGVPARGVIERGDPVDSIIALAKREGVDEIVAYSHGKRGLKRRLMGSFTAKLAEEADCPVVILK